MKTLNTAKIIAAALIATGLSASATSAFADEYVTALNNEAHAVAGVEAVQVVELHRSEAPLPVFVPRLFAALPEAGLTGTPLAAELLALDAAPVTLELMS